MASTLPLTQVQQELKEKVALSCRIVGNRGISRGTLGHVSVRLPGTDNVLIKAKGPDEEALEYATARDVMTITIGGETVEAADGLAAPQETAMHLAVYRKRPEVQSVIHAHPDWVVILAGTGKPLVPMLGAYDGNASYRLLSEGVPLYPRSLTIVNDELGEDFMQTMGQHRVCVLFGHGITAAGSSVEDVTQTCLTLYEIARINYLAYAIGQPQGIPERDVQEVGERRTAGRNQGVHTSRSGEPSFWRYERRRLPDVPPGGN
jgi:ribulose-5-phosphate 4-epimerase/fuculose-1-phosphate aldolase